MPAETGGPARNPWIAGREQPGSDQRPGAGVTCVDFRVRLDTYLDGELPVDEMAAVGAHAAACWPCGELTRLELEARQLLLRQPRECVPAEIRARIAARARRRARSDAFRRRRLTWVLAAVAAVALAVVPFAMRGRPIALVRGLVDTHLAFTQVAAPAELASSDRGEVEVWFRRRAGLGIVVPDFTAAGLRLIGGRIVAVHERRAAYLLYAKGPVLMSVFVLPAGGDGAMLAGRPVTHRGRTYLTDADRGQRTVAWTDRRASFGLISTLPHDVLLECADRLQRERAGRQTL